MPVFGFGESVGVWTADIWAFCMRMGKQEDPEACNLSQLVIRTAVNMTNGMNAPVKNQLNFK